MTADVTAELTLDDLKALTAMVRDVLTDTCTPESLADPEEACTAVWEALTDVGVARLGLDEALGGDGGGLLAAAEVIRLVGEYAAPGPLAETMLLGGWLLEVAGCPQPTGPVSTGPTSLTARQDGDVWHVHGTVERVPVAPGVTIVAVVTDDTGAELLAVLPHPDQPETVGHNLAGERRDTFRMDLLSDSSAGILHPLPVGTANELRMRGALTRALLSSGALRRLQQRTLTYAGERVQFGRPIAAFQAVQQQLAKLVAEASAAAAATDQAVRAAISEGFGAEHTQLLVAAAKVRTAQSASSASGIAHQIHGALGMTDEHPLHHSTTRLWSWRSEWGNEASWSEEIADRALSAGSAGLWPLVTGVR